LLGKSAYIIEFCYFSKIGTDVMNYIKFISQNVGLCKKLAVNLIPNLLPVHYVVLPYDITFLFVRISE
jgi:hypothetical protein